VTLTATPASGYKFVRWDGDVTGTNPTATVTMNANKAVTAVFAAINQYTLNVQVSPAAGGTVTKSPDQSSYTEGSTVTLTATAAAGYVFSSWSGDVTGTTNPVTVTMNSNKTIIANFTQVPTYTLTVTIVPAAGGTVTKSPDQTSYSSGATVTLTATPAAGYKFVNWAGDVSGTTNPVTVTMDANKAVTAVFAAINQYTLNVQVSPAAGGTVTKSPDQSSYTEGSTVTLTATAAAGYVFSSWSGDVTGTTNPVTVTMNSNKTIIANFTQVPTYTLTVTNVPAAGGTVAKSPDQANYYQGETVTLTATPAYGYVFSSWSGDVTGTTNPVTVTMDGNKAVTANYTALPTYVLETKVLGAYYWDYPDPQHGNYNESTTAGKIDASPTGPNYPQGTEVTLTATASTGFVFVDWYDTVNGISLDTNPVLKVTMNENKGIAARFVQIAVKLSIAYDPAQGYWGGYTDFSKVVWPWSKGVQPLGYKLTPQDINNFPLPYGVKVNLTAYPNAGYGFKRWYGDIVSTDNPISFQMTKDVNLGLEFEMWYQFTYAASPGTAGTVTLVSTSTTPDSNGYYAPGTVVKLKATANDPSVAGDRYAFIGWGGDISGTANPIQFTLTGTKQTIEAIAQFKVMDPAIKTDLTKLTFTASYNGSTPDQTFTITNSGGGELNVKIDTTNLPAWITVTPTTFSNIAWNTTTSQVTVSVTTVVNGVPLARGTYTANIVITSTNATNSPVTIPVTFTIGD